MFITRHRVFRWAAKAILTVICFSLFTAQASSKFYQFASTRALYYLNDGLNKSMASHQDATIVKDCAHDRYTVHSLDKRFDLSQLFLLPTPAAGVITPLPERSYHSSRPPAGVIARTRGMALMRGPPAIEQ